MRNLAKYFLALAVMGGGFYAAQQHRRPNGNAASGTVAVREPTVEPFDRGGQQPPGAVSPTALPVAALADVDRLPLLDADRTKTPGRSTLSETASVTKQPTLRVDSPAEPSPSAASVKTSDSDAINVDSKKQAEVKSKPKRQGPKKTSTAKTEDKAFAPPELAHEYRPRAERFENGKEADAERHGESELQDTASSSTSSARTKPQASPPAATPHRHRIAEGDTLARLAEKYLGNRDRYLDLFQANADVLFDPRLIPIGVEIVIPDRTTIVARAPTASATVGDGGRNPTPPSEAASDAP